MIDILEIAKVDGLKQGMQQGMHQMVLTVLKEKVGVLPSYVIDKINTITQQEVLTDLIRYAVNCENIGHFEEQLKVTAS